MSNFNEAPASSNVRFESPNGFEWQFTLRADTGKRLLEMMAAFERTALAEGYRPQGRRSQPAGNSNGYQNGGQANNNKQQEAGSFTIASLEYGGRSNKGDDSWRVKGGNYMTYGLMMYPEQWQASNLQMPAPGQQINVIGWTAHHNGKKIIRIEPATQLQPPSQPIPPQLSPVAERELQVNGHKWQGSNGNGVSHYQEIDF